MYLSPQILHEKLPFGMDHFGQCSCNQSVCSEPICTGSLDVALGTFSSGEHGE